MVVCAIVLFLLSCIMASEDYNQPVNAMEAVYTSSSSSKNIYNEQSPIQNKGSISNANPEPETFPPVLLSENAPETKYPTNTSSSTIIDVEFPKEDSNANNFNSNLKFRNCDLDTASINSMSEKQLLCKILQMLKTFLETYLLTNFSSGNGFNSDIEATSMNQLTQQQLLSKIIETLQQILNIYSSKSFGDNAVEKQLLTNIYQALRYLSQSQSMRNLDDVRDVINISDDFPQPSIPYKEQLSFKIVPSLAKLLQRLYMTPSEKKTTNPIFQSYFAIKDINAATETELIEPSENQLLYEIIPALQNLLDSYLSKDFKAKNGPSQDDHPSNVLPSVVTFKIIRELKLLLQTYLLAKLSPEKSSNSEASSSNLLIQQKILFKIIQALEQLLQIFSAENLSVNSEKNKQHAANIRLLIKITQALKHFLQNQSPENSSPKSSTINLTSNNQPVSSLIPLVNDFDKGTRSRYILPYRSLKDGNLVFEANLTKPIQKQLLREIIPSLQNLLDTYLPKDSKVGNRPLNVQPKTDVSTINPKLRSVIETGNNLKPISEDHSINPLTQQLFSKIIQTLESTLQMYSPQNVDADIEDNTGNQPTQTLKNLLNSQSLENLDSRRDELLAYPSSSTLQSTKTTDISILQNLLDTYLSTDSDARSSSNFNNDNYHSNYPTISDNNFQIPETSSSENFENGKLVDHVVESVRSTKTVCMPLNKLTSFLKKSPYRSQENILVTPPQSNFPLLKDYLSSSLQEDTLTSQPRNFIAFPLLRRTEFSKSKPKTFNQFFSQKIRYPSNRFVYELDEQNVKNAGDSPSRFTTMTTFKRKIQSPLSERQVRGKVQYWPEWFNEDVPNYSANRDAEGLYGSERGMVRYYDIKSDDVIERRIIGGEIAQPGEFPYQVALYANSIFQCGSSLISEYYVLTAAHCLEGFDASELWFRAGSNSLLQGGDGYRVAKAVIHEKYDNGDFDIGLVKSRIAVKLGPHVKPIELPSADSSEISPGTTAIVSGWGAITNEIADESSSKPSYKLYKLELKITTRERCSKRVMDSTRIITKRQICTSNTVPAGTCFGDSGGPLVSNGKLVGIISWGSPCAIGDPDVYTNVLEFLPWIVSQIKILESKRAVTKKPDFISTLDPYQLNTLVNEIINP